MKKLDFCFCVLFYITESMIQWYYGRGNCHFVARKVLMHVLPNFSLLITKIYRKLSKLCLVRSVLIVNTARRYIAVFNKNTVCSTVTFNTAVYFWYRYTPHHFWWWTFLSTRRARNKIATRSSIMEGGLNSAVFTDRPHCLLCRAL